MIKINKNFDAVPAILLKKGNTSKKGSLLQIQDAINAKKGSEYSSYKNVYEELKTLYSNKCAYCEEKVIKERELENGETSQRKMNASIDHYRPKDAGYYWLGNEWSNLLFACSTCNSSVKKTKFPIKNSKAIISSTVNLFDSKENFDTTHFYSDTSIFRADKAFLLAESPLLLHPEIDEPKEHLTFDSWGKIKGITERGERTIQDLALYRFDDDRNAIIGDILSLIKVLHIELFDNKISIEKYNADLRNVLCSKILLRQVPKSEFSFWYQFLTQNFEICILRKLEISGFSDIETTHIKTLFEECEAVITTKTSHYE